VYRELQARSGSGRGLLSFWRGLRRWGIARWDSSSEWAYPPDRNAAERLLLPYGGLSYLTDTREHAARELPREAVGVGLRVAKSQET
jgi:hypothetical protein